MKKTLLLIISLAFISSCASTRERQSDASSRINNSENNSREIFKELGN